MSDGMVIRGRGDYTGALDVWSTMGGVLNRTAVDCVNVIVSG